MFRTKLFNSFKLLRQSVIRDNFLLFKLLAYKINSKDLILLFLRLLDILTALSFDII